MERQKYVVRKVLGEKLKEKIAGHGGALLVEPALERLRQEDHAFKASENLVRSCLSPSANQ